MVDRLVPAHQSEILHEALTEAGVKSELYLVEGGGHGNFKDPTVAIREAAFMEAFLQRSLGD